jgi:hypothetical protein
MAKIELPKDIKGWGVLALEGAVIVATIGLAAPMLGGALAVLATPLVLGLTGAEVIAAMGGTVIARFIASMI